MATLQFYKNPYQYPKFSQGLATYGSTMDCTPVGINLRTGTIRVKGDFNDFMSCNYLRLTMDGRTIWGWIDDVRFRTEDSFDVTYSVDAWRTYQSKIILGSQFIVRSPMATFKRDSLLGSYSPYKATSSVLHTIGVRDKRVLVVQCRNKTDGIFSNTPVQPTPYQFYLCEFDVNNWQATAAIRDLMTYLAANEETSNIVTLYSIPYVNLSGIPQTPLIILPGNHTIHGFRMMGTGDVSSTFSNEAAITINQDIDQLMRVDHSVQLVIPEAGIISIPDELLVLPDLKLRQDIDVFSGASNYMLKSGLADYYHLSVRGSSISSIPVVSDPFDTYISQNQNALATSLMGDVASIAMGTGMLAGTGGVGAALGGGGSIAGGVNGILNTAMDIESARDKVSSNPPAFLGTALASKFNQRFWTVTTKSQVDNEELIRSDYGYPMGKVWTLTFPAAGYIETKNCNVSGDGSVPRWALDEINNMFNNGVLVK